MEIRESSGIGHSPRLSQSMRPAMTMQSAPLAGQHMQNFDYVRGAGASRQAINS
jgi:hypothetical protein